MGPGDWVQVGIGLIYAAILWVMVLQLRKSGEQLRHAREAATDSSRQMREAIELSQASAAATRDLAREHAELVAHAAASATAAADAARTARDANAIAVAAHEAEQRRRAEVRVAVATRVLAQLMPELRALNAARARVVNNQMQEPPRRAIRHAAGAIARVGPEDQVALGPGVTKDLLRLYADLLEAGVSATKLEFRGPLGLLPVVEHAERLVHTFVVALWTVAHPDEAVPDLEALRKEAWHKLLTG